MQQQLRGGLAQNMGASSMAHPPFSSRAMPDQHLQQQQHQPSGVPNPAHLAMYPNMGMSLPQNGLQPHAGGPPFNNMGNLNGSPTYMISNVMQSRHLGAAGPGQPQALPGPQVCEPASPLHHHRVIAGQKPCCPSQMCLDFLQHHRMVGMHKLLLLDFSCMSNLPCT